MALTGLTFGSLLAITSAALHAQNTSPLHGDLRPGRHAVGFRTVAMHDVSRDRPLVAHVWYPAASSSGHAMTFGEATVAHLEGRPQSELRQREEATRRFFTQFGGLSDEAWAKLLATPLLASRDAPPAAGRFPLLIGTLRPLSTTVTSEYLASHGYVVTMVHGDPPTVNDAGAALDVGYRDMEFAIPEVRKLPFVDGRALAALGFSGSGFSQILLAMRHPQVQAVCDLESAIFDDRILWSLQRGYGYDVGALRVPFLHTYSVPLSRLENRIADFEQMRYSTRYRYLVDAPGIHHWDFATEGMAASVTGVRGEHGPRLKQVFETTNRYVLAFFDAYLRKDAAALAFLRRDPAANGAPAGLASIRELPGIEPAPTIEAFERMVLERGAAAMTAFESAKQRDPSAGLFVEAQLNRLGYRLLNQGKKPADAVLIFRKAVEYYPASPNAYDSLSEGLEAAGLNDEAVKVAHQGLAVLAKADVPEQTRTSLGDGLRARIGRLVKRSPSDLP
jgi:tetratricopeptide (TPR) repeat protein